MDNNQYHYLYLFLSQQPLPPHVTQQQQQQIQRVSTNFILKNNFIYKKDKRKNGNLLRLVKRQELEHVLYMGSLQ
jgi:hypothetical protein